MRKKYTEGEVNYISYKPLFKLLIDKGMSSPELSEKAGVSSATLTAMRQNLSVTLDTIVKICIALDCPIEAIVEVVKEGN